MENKNRFKGENNKWYPTQMPVDLASATFNACELMELEFNPMRWAVEGFLPEGCVLFAGRPKLGKSWFAFNLAVAIATGGYVLGKIGVEQGEVLYLALEDGKRRLKTRLNALATEQSVPASLHMAVQWPCLDRGGLPALSDWLRLHPNTRLIIIDTLQRVRPQNVPGVSVYENDYNALAMLADLARQFQVCILVIHHTRKADAADAFDTVSGSTGLTGAVDATMVLKRARGKLDAELHITGRDIEEAEKALRFDKASMTWLLMGEAEEQRQSEARSEILEYIEGTDQILSPKQIAEGLGKNESTVRKMLSRMAKDGQIKLLGFGKYTSNKFGHGVTVLKK